MNSASRPTSRKAAQRRGRAAEGLAALWLRLKGYAILARGLKSGRGSGAGEVDLVARRSDVVVFVEVKSRASLDQAIECLTPFQRQRIERGAAAFLARRPDLAGCGVRFDMVLITPWSWPRHVPDAWRID
jgi:putative endonuclease